MAGSVSSEIKAEPNLTPMLDVVFQLITFFMLIFRISGENFDQRVQLPVAGSARPVEGQQALLDRFVMNVDELGNVLWQGQVLDFDAAAKEIKNQAAIVRLNLEVTTGKTPKAGEGLPTVVILRGDRRVEFSRLFRLITNCQANGFTRFNLKAMNAES